MTKAELNLLEKVFNAEIEGALNSRSRLYQTQSKLAKKMVEDGFLVETEFTLGGRFPVVVRGFELTELGRLAYCSNV